VTDILFRLQSATGPNRELDAGIALANGWTERRREDLQGPYTRWHGPKGQDYPNAPRYTESIDAALTLVPEGAVWHIMTDYGGLIRAKVGPQGLPSASIYNVDDRPLFVEADGATPAIALLIAIERAKEDSKP